MATKPKGTSVVKWDEELASQAEIAAGMEQSTASGQFFSIRGGQLTWNDAAMPGNQMAVVILDSVLENVFYEGTYDPEDPKGPTCFAFGRDDASMKPHKIVVDAGNDQHQDCAGCPNNEWGSADVGRGKACKNVRRLGMIVAGNFNAAGKFELNEDPEHYESAAVGYLKLPVTSVKGYAAFVKQVAGALKRPPFGIATRVKVVPDPKSQFKVVFEPLMNLPDELMPVVMKRNEEVKALIEFPYQPNEERDEPPPKRGSRAAKQPAKTNRKY